MDTSKQLSAFLIICVLSFSSVSPTTCRPPDRMESDKRKGAHVLYPPVVKPPPFVYPPIVKPPPVVIPPIVKPPPFVYPPIVKPPPVIIPPIVKPPPVIIPPIIKPPPVIIPPIIKPPPVVIPPITIPRVHLPPHSKPGYYPPKGSPTTCSADAVKLGLCVDLLTGVVNVKLGDPAVNECCPVLEGLLELEAAVCLCTTLKLKLLSLDIYVPIALQLLAVCGKTPPSGYSCY